MSAYIPTNILFDPAEFRSGKAPILIATDVASRGLGMCAHKYSSYSIFFHMIVTFCIFL